MSRGWETAQLVECLKYNHEYLSSIPQTTSNLGLLTCACNANAEEAETGGWILDLSGQAA